MSAATTRHAASPWPEPSTTGKTALQARELTDTLGVLEEAGVDGAFINTFIFEISPYDEDPRYDLDACNAGLVRPLTGGRRGTTWDIRVSPRLAQGPEPSHGPLGRDPGVRPIVD